MKTTRNAEYLDMIDRSKEQIKQGKVVVKTMEELDNAAELDENSLEMSLPKYLKDDIDDLMKGYENNSTLLDCLYCEVQGSINSALYGNEITEEQAVFLREKYLGLEG